MIRRTDTPRLAEVIQVVHTVAVRGAGEEGDPVRAVDQYWSFDGKLLAERDPEHAQGTQGRSEHES